MYKLICQKPARLFICPNGWDEYLAQLPSNVYCTWDVCMYNFDIDTKIDQTIAQNPTRDEKRSLKDSLVGTTMTDLA